VDKTGKAIPASPQRAENLGQWQTLLAAQRSLWRRRYGAMAQRHGLRPGRHCRGRPLRVEGKISINEWTADDGAKRHGLSVLAWHCRLPRIGKNRAKSDKSKPQQQPVNERPFYSDDMPF
jgi:hypothetical protein